MFDGLKRHWTVAKEAYRREKEAATRNMPIHQQDFLPAALAVMEKPASPAGRFTMWAIVSLFTIALVWAVVGKIDVVAVATGKTITQGQVKVVQSYEPGVVAGIYVENGDHVSQGQVLVELDPTVSTADVTRLRRQRQAAVVTRDRNQWILNKLDGAAGDDLQFKASDLVDSEIARVQQLLSATQLNEYEAVQAAYAQQLEEKQSELNVVRKQLNKLEETLPLLEEQVNGMSKLSADGVTARFQYLEYEERMVARRKDIVIEQDRILQVQASIRAIEKQREQHQQEFRKQLVSEQAEPPKTSSPSSRSWSKPNSPATSSAFEHRWTALSSNWRFTR